MAPPLRRPSASRSVPVVAALAAAALTLACPSDSGGGDGDAGDGGIGKGADGVTIFCSDRHGRCAGRSATSCRKAGPCRKDWMVETFPALSDKPAFPSHPGTTASPSRPNWWIQ